MVPCVPVARAIRPTGDRQCYEARHLAGQKENGGVREDPAVPCSSTTRCGPRSSAQQLHRSVHPLDPVARVTLSLRASLYGLLASTRFRLTMDLVTHQHAQRRNRTNV